MMNVHDILLYKEALSACGFTVIKTDKLEQLRAEKEQLEVETSRQKCEINGLVATGLADDAYCTQLRAELDEARNVIEETVKYITTTSASSTKIDAFQRWPKAGALYRKAAAWLEAHPK